MLNYQGMSIVRCTDQQAWEVFNQPTLEDHWPSQEPIDWRGYVREYPSKIWPEIWYVYVPPSIGSWHSHWEDNILCFQIVSFHEMSWALFSFPPRWLGLEFAVLRGVESKIECLVRPILLANYQGTTRSSSINNTAMVDVWKYLDKLWL